MVFSHHSGISLMVEQRISNPLAGVRFSYPAQRDQKKNTSLFAFFFCVEQSSECERLPILWKSSYITLLSIYKKFTLNYYKKDGRPYRANPRYS